MSHPPQPGRQALSVVITTFNNAATLARCIDSVPFAAEILVLDSHSTDGTAELAAALGARVEQAAFRGYGPQKQLAIQRAQHDRVGAAGDPRPGGVTLQGFLPCGQTALRCTPGLTPVG